MLVLVAALISAWPELPLERHSPAAARSDVAVIAGIDDYFMLPDIDGAADSATDWFRFFVDTQGVPAERVFLLRNADVTKEQLTDVTRKAATLAGPTDTLWVVVVGHGVPGTDGDGVFLTVDTQANERSIEARGISQGALLAAATGSQAQTVGVFDACFSGTSARGPLLDNVQFTMPLRRVEPRSKT